MIRVTNSKLSGNGVYYTSSFMLLVKKMLCGKPHLQKGINLISFSHKSGGGTSDQGAERIGFAGSADAPCLRVEGKWLRVEG